MPQKSGTALGLLNKTVDINDNSFLSSVYFQLSEFNQTFGLGKNSIVINNTPNDLLIEAYDNSGNLLFYETAVNNDFINVQKSKSLIISFYVYSDNSPGIGKLILVGSFNGKVVRYIANLNLDVNQINFSKVRFYATPTLEIAPLLTFATKITSSEANPKFTTGSFFGKAVYPSPSFNVDETRYNKSLTDYQITTTNNQFSSSFESFFLNLNINTIKDAVTSTNVNVATSSSILIKNVLNNKIVQLATPFIYNNSANNKNVITDIIQGDYTLTYSDYTYHHELFTTSSYLTESVGLNGTRYKRYSIAEVTYRNMNTFSGTVVRHKIYKKSLNIASDYSLLLDENFNENEILKNDIVPVKSYQNLGSFYTQDFINTFWFSSSNTFNLIQSPTVFIDGMLITGSSVSAGHVIVKLNTATSNRDASYVNFNYSQYLNQSGSAYDANFIKLLKDNEYSLGFNCSLLSKQTTDITELDFYLIGSSPDNQKELDYNATYGVHLGNLEISDAATFKHFKNYIQFKFKPLNDLYGTLVIVPRGFNKLIIGNISLQLIRTNGFTQNSYTVRVPFNVDQPNELFDIKAELYDNNANLVYSNLRTLQTFDPLGLSSPSQVGAGGNAIFGDVDILSSLKLSYTLPTLGPGAVNLGISGSIVGVF